MLNDVCRGRFRHGYWVMSLAVLAVMAVASGSVTVAWARAWEVHQQSWGFDDQKAGKYSPKFAERSGIWRVTVDKTAPSAPHVLAQTVANPASILNTALAIEATYKDIDLSVTARVVAGSGARGGGLMWRVQVSKDCYQDPTNYYQLGYDALTERVNLVRVRGGRRQTIRTVPVKGASEKAQRWHTLRAVMEGDRIQCFFDGRRCINTRDLGGIGAGGRIGVWTQGDARTHFDDFRVKGE